MKVVRVLFLLLLAALLPIRGAVASAMLCEMGGAQQSQAAAAAAHGQMVDALMNDATDHGDCAGAQDDAVGDRCTLCAAFCSLTPLVSEMPRLPGPQALAALKFPSLSTAALSFLSDGQERPPRSC